MGKKYNVDGLSSLRSARVPTQTHQDKMRDGVKVIKPTDAEFSEVVKQCTPVLQIERGRGKQVYPFRRQS